MAIADGTYGFGSDHGRLTLRTGRAGLGRRAGHDLTIEAARWRGTATVDTAEPASNGVALTVEVDSLAVVEGVGGLKPLTDDDRAEIVRALRGKQLLHTAKYPEIGFVSTNVSGSPDAFVVQGDLTILGRTRPITVDCALDGDGRVRGTAALAQSNWGIRPYSVFFGALKLADEVRIEFETELVPAA
ncbi:YceI family protein [Glycomyces buryatensis]|uniref:YceI family protein n=1 Tax=Glycomyces buryatensis TaxID=2570927 RepID=A0A4S8Q046_9ACTN|nr:YceI family protein [Glycomyces buryatensis]THV36381.1 YceI family protein [Glycomyces buryatensis]